MQDLKITLIQSKLHWEDSAANLAMFEEKIWEIEGTTDVIVLPEMFSTGFSMSAKGLAEVMNLQTTKWMRRAAEQTKALVLGSFIARDGDQYFNRLLWMQPDGQVKIYDKRHLFRMAEEHAVYTGGVTRLIANWKGWNICPLVCYDLRFPVWSRNGIDPLTNGMLYDLLIYVANWPEARVTAWDSLLQARAIENLSYTVGVNRTGADGLGIRYNGHSAIIGPRGEKIFVAGEEEVVQTIVLEARPLLDHRKKFPAYLDADDFTIR